MPFWAQAVVAVLTWGALTLLVRAVRAASRERALLQARDAAGLPRPVLFSRSGKIAIALVLLPLLAILVIAALN